MLPKQVLLDSKHAKRFEREARAAAKLHHTNIVPVFGVGQQDGLHYYVMQFIHGLGLDEVLVELKRLREASEFPHATAEQQIASVVVAGAAEKAAVGRDVSALDVAQSLVSGRFQRTLIVESDSGSGQPSAVSDQESGDGGGPATTRTSPLGSQHAAREPLPDTTVGRLSETAAGSGNYAWPGQSEAQRKTQSRTVYWQSIARIGVQAAEALQYAHDQGVIHRDVKPGNLLLDARGCVWVTDFGLAKVADQQDLTHTGDVLGTLRYMAPEQFNGQADARSDVYALGLTLYELLALQPGFDEKDRHKLIKQVTTGAPARLRAIDAHVPRDLETIIHKAIERDPAQRYQTAGDLAADLQRYLGDEPIRARRISPVTRFTRWCKRNPVVAGLTTAIAVLITTAAVVASITAVRFETLAGDLQGALGDAKRNLTLANAETKRAEAALAQVQSEQQRAEGNLDLALTALDAVYLDAIGTEKLMGNQRTRPQAGAAGFSPSASAPLTDLEKELLKRGLRFYDQFAQQNSATSRAAVQTAQAHFRVGLLHGALGDDAAAETAYRTAIERFEALVKEEPNNVEYHRRLAQSCSGLSRTISDWDIARTYAARSIDAFTTAIQLAPENADLYAERAGESSFSSKGADAAADVLRAAELDPDNVLRQVWAARAMYWSNNPEAGRPFAERAFKLDPSSALAAYTMTYACPGDEPEQLRYLTLAIERDPKLVDAWQRRSEVYHSQGAYEQALVDARQAVELSPDSDWALTDLGRALVGLKRYDEAKQALQRALSIHPHAWFAFAVLGELHLAQQQFDEAVEALSQAIRRLPPEHWLYKRRAQAFFSLGRFPEALADLTQALTLRPQDTSTLVWLGPTAIAACPDEAFKEGLLKLADQVVDNAGTHPTRLYRVVLSLAFEDYDKARHDFEILPPPENSDYSGQMLHASLCLRMQDPAGYRARCQDMVERFAETVDPNAANTVAWTCALGPQALDDYSPAVALANKAIDAQPDNQMYLNTLGAILFRAGRYQDALEALDKGITLRGHVLEEDAIFLSMIHQHLGNKERAAESLEQAKELNALHSPNRGLEVEPLLREAEALVLNAATDPVPPTDSTRNAE